MLSSSFSFCPRCNKRHGEGHPTRQKKLHFLQYSGDARTEMPRHNIPGTIAAEEFCSPTSNRHTISPRGHRLGLLGLCLTLLTVHAHQHLERGTFCGATDTPSVCSWAHGDCSSAPTLCVSRYFHDFCVTEKKLTVPPKQSSSTQTPAELQLTHTQQWLHRAYTHVH